MIRRIRTEQAPSAKPVSVSVSLTDQWQLLVDAPEYDVPVVGFGQARRIAPGVAEISSPLLVTNITSTVASVFVRIRRALRRLVVGQTHIQFAGFTGGEGYTVGDTLTLNNSAEVTITDVDANGSVTEFEVTISGGSVYEGDVLTEVMSSSGVGFGFGITVEDSNLDSQTYRIANNFPVEPRDTAILPLNGQFLQTGDRLEVRADSNDALEATISFTEGQSEEDDVVTDIPGNN